MSIPKRGEFGEPLKGEPEEMAYFALYYPGRIATCVNALSACDPDKLGELIRAARAMEKVVPHANECEGPIIALQEALDAFTERSE